MGTRRRTSCVYPAAALSLVAGASGLVWAASSGEQSGRRKQEQQAAPPATLPRPTVTADPKRPHLLPLDEFLPTSQLKAGMKGYGLTVFQGSTIERFDVTILGVVRKLNNGRDLILVKLSGPKLRRVTDVMAGMSGSPVYVNGKIVGAVAYGSQFTRESIGYLTPIEDMLDAWDPSLPQTPGDGEMNESGGDAAGGDAGDAVTSSRSTPKTLGAPSGLRPLLAKVSVSGVPTTRFSRVARALEQLGLEARQGEGGGTAGVGVKGSPLRPGGAIAMSLATGDIDITAIGTLTYRKGDRVVAFGHPFLGIGPIEAPMYSAYIHDIEPSFAESHKIGSPVSLVGTFSQDRPFSVGGRIGVRPVMVPISVHIRDKALNKERTFRAQLLRHPQITPVLTAMAAGTAIAEVHSEPGDAMATVTTEVMGDGIGPIRRTNRVYDAAAIDEAAISDLRSMVSLLSSNPFAPIGIRSVKMDVTIEPGRRTAQVERIFLKQSRFEPGDDVEVGVVLKPYKRDRVIRTLHLRIPPTAPAGTVMLTVQGGGAGGGSLGGISIGGINLGTLMGSRGIDYSGLATMEQAVHRFEERDRNDALVARLALPTGAITVGGEKLSDLPPNIEAAMRSGASRTSGIRVERDEVKASAPSEYVVSGGQVLPIHIVRRSGASEPPPGMLPAPSSISAPGGNSPSSSSPPQTPAPASPAQPSFTGGAPDSDSDPESEGEPEASVSGIDTGTAAPAPRIAGSPPAPVTKPSPKSLTTIPAKAPEVGETGPSAAASAGAKPMGGTKPVGRMPGIWRQSGTDLRVGELVGVTATSLGDIRLAPKLARVADSSDPYFWSLASDGAGGVYAGSGDGGVIYHVTADGKRAAFARTGELEIHALARGSDGTLYAGTSPHGRVLQIGRDGKVSTLLQTGLKYVLALTMDPRGETLYAAAGGPRARVYEIPLRKKGGVEIRYESDETSATALAVGPGGDLYAGTAPSALVVHVAGPNLSRPTVLYDAAEAAISGLAVAPNGCVYAAAAPRGVLYRLASGCAPRVVYDRAPGGTLSGLVLAANGTLYTASGSSVVALSPDGGDIVRTYEAPSDIQILSLLRDEGGRLWASTGNVGGVYRLEDAGDGMRGTLVSSVFDARATATWGTLRWTADVPDGAGLLLQTRSGNTAAPDKSWSGWSRAYGVATGERIASPSSRYLQYRVAFAGGRSVGPILRSVEAFYLTPNQAPQVTLQSPRGGEVWRGSKVIRWSGSDADHDTLSFDVYLSANGGATWKRIRDSAMESTPVAVPRKPDASAGVMDSGDKQPAGEKKMLSVLEAELNRHPEISPEMKARMLADAPAQIRQVSPPDAPLPGGVGTTRETSLPLNTATLADGDYLLKVVATDRPSNPVGALTTEKISGSFRVVNHPPILTVLDKAVTVQADKSVRIEGVALHPLVAVAAVQFRVDGTDWIAAVAQDGIFDSQLEQFTLTTGPLSSGAHTIEIEVQDEAGNAATQKRTVTVP